MDKTGSPFLWGSSQDLGSPSGADGATRWMSSVGHPRHLVPYPQGQAALAGLSWEPAWSGLLLMLPRSPSVPRIQMLRWEQHDIGPWGVLCGSVPLCPPREQGKWEVKKMDGEKELRLCMVSGPQDYLLALHAFSFQGWRTAWLFSLVLPMSTEWLDWHWESTVDTYSLQHCST